MIVLQIHIRMEDHVHMEWLDIYATVLLVELGIPVTLEWLIYLSFPNL